MAARRPDWKRSGRRLCGAIRDPIDQLCSGQVANWLTGRESLLTSRRGRDSVMRTHKLALVAFLFSLGGLTPLLDRFAGGIVPRAQAANVSQMADAEGSLDTRLATALAQAHFTGTIEQVFHERLEAALGRPI